MPKEQGYPVEDRYEKPISRTGPKRKKKKLKEHLRDAYKRRKMMPEIMRGPYMQKGRPRDKLDKNKN